MEAICRSVDSMEENGIKKNRSGAVMVSEQIANLPYVSKRILGSSPSHSAKLSSKASTYLLLTFISLSAINNISCGCDVMVA